MLDLSGHWKRSSKLNFGLNTCGFYLISQHGHGNKIMVVISVDFRLFWGNEQNYDKQFQTSKMRFRYDKLMTRIYNDHNITIWLFDAV